jgi:hypothetical protein
MYEDNDLSVIMPKITQLVTQNTKNPREFGQYKAKPRTYATTDITPRAT